MTIGYHINATARTIEPFTYTAGAFELRAILDCRIMGSGGRLDDNLFLVDDNGLLEKPALHFWRLIGWSPVPHDAILVGPDHIDADGNETWGDPTISVEAVRGQVEWLSRADFEAWLEVHADEPAAVVNGVTLRTWAQVYAEAAPLPVIAL